MKRLLFLLILAVACRQSQEAPATASAPVTPEPATTTTAAAPAPAEAQLDPTGAYFAMAELPPEFAELEHLSLATIDENAAPAPLNGFLRPKDRDAKDYVLESPRLEGRSLMFRTAAVDGVHYEFSGEFTTTGDFAANPPSSETPVLTGELTKVRNGRIEASTPVQFRYEAGG